MKNKIVPILAILATLIGLASPTYAQSEFTLAGDSLIGLEARTVEGDYTDFFALQNFRDVDLADVESDLAQVDFEGENLFYTDDLWFHERNRAVMELNNNLQLIMENSDLPPVNAMPFRKDAERHVSDRMQVLIGIPF